MSWLSNLFGGGSGGGGGTVVSTETKQFTSAELTQYLELISSPVINVDVPIVANLPVLASPASPDITLNVPLDKLAASLSSISSDELRQADLEHTESLAFGYKSLEIEAAQAAEYLKTQKAISDQDLMVSRADLILRAADLALESDIEGARLAQSEKLLSIIKIAAAGAALFLFMKGVKS